MSKILRVVEPFFTMSAGDTLELSEDNKTYTHEYNEKFDKADGDGVDMYSTYSSQFAISVSMAKSLMDQGYLEEVNEQKTDFVNIFDEINQLLDKYNKELIEVEKDKDSVPACMRVEKTTVLSNLIKVLNHLKSLKK